MEIKKIIKSEEEWKECLSELAFQVTRKSMTEKPFMDHGFPNLPGKFKCVCCNADLFSSTAKFDSGTGWPSFYDVMSSGAVKVKVDRSHGMLREEVLCGKCDAHLGHVFSDGPQPTGLRYCINSLSLDFEND